MYSKLVCGLFITVSAVYGAGHNLVWRDGALGHHEARAVASASGYEQPLQEAVVSYGYDDPTPADTWYGVPTGYREEDGFDIVTLLIPFLILVEERVVSCTYHK